MPRHLPAADYEQAYDLLAAAIDRVGLADEAAFLSRACLLLMDLAPDLASVQAALRAAERAAAGNCQL